MNDLSAMIWVELRKALRSRMPLWTALGSLFMPLGITFLIFVARNPQISQQLGLVSAKANIVAYAATDWPIYLQVYSEIIAVGGLILFILITSWIFGREFSDGTVKELLAVPVQRGSIVLAKYAVLAVWSAAMSAVIFAAGLILGALMGLPGGSSGVLLAGSGRVFITSLLTIAVVLPFALFASMGRGYLLPIGLAILMMMVVNLAQVLGWGEFLPWAVPALYAMGKDPLTPLSYWLVVLTGLIGMLVTYLWWKYADQHR